MGLKIKFFHTAYFGLKKVFYEMEFKKNLN